MINDDADVCTKEISIFRDAFQHNRELLPPYELMQWCGELLETLRAHGCTERVDNAILIEIDRLAVVVIGGVCDYTGDIDTDRLSLKALFRNQHRIRTAANMMPHVERLVNARIAKLQDQMKGARI